MVVVPALIGCGSVGAHSKGTTASSSPSPEAEIAALEAQLEAQSEELRLVRGQLALARAEVTSLRSESGGHRAVDPVRASATDRRLPWLAKPTMIQTEDGEREVLAVFEHERLSTTTEVPALPEFVEEQTLAATPQTDPAVDDYRRALGLVRERRLDEALAVLTAFVDAYANHPYADNALFWCGEIHYLRREYRRALEQFEAIEKHHPWGNKLPDALYRIGQIHLKNGDRVRARVYFDKVAEQFPDTAAARLALREDAS